MDADLMDAILAMNAYDASGTTGIITGSTIGNWSSIRQDSIPGQNYFAVVYQDGSNYTISYRGTTNLLGDDISGFFGSDVWNGYATGVGSPASNDSTEAIQLYQSVLAQAGSISNITLTGHSMGGGLAGLVGDLYGAKAVVFDNMAFEAAANAAYAASIPGPDYNAALGNLIYGSSTPTAPSEANLKGYYTDGEFLYSLDRQLQNLPETVLEPHTDSGDLSGLQLHSMALATMLLYASDNSLTKWNAVAPYLLPELWNENVASAAGVDQYKNVSTSSSADALKEMIAYSAIDEGTMPFGDVAIKAFFDDAGDLSDLVPSDQSVISNTDAFLYKDLSDIAIQYAGQLAAEKSTDASLALGIVHSDLSTVSVDLTPSEWSNGPASQTPTAPNIVGANGAVVDAIMSAIGTSVLDSYQADFNNLFKSQGAALISGITEIEATDKSGVALNGGAAASTFSGTAGGALLIGSTTGNTSFVGAAGTNIMIGQASDTFNTGVGNNIVIEQNAGVATLDASSASSSSPNWNMVEGAVDSAETFVFQSANLAPLTVVYGNDGSDTFDFEADAGKNIGVYILQMNDINQANFLALDPSKIDAYIDQNFGSTGDDGYGGGFDDKIVLINPTASDILKYNGQIVSDPTRYVQYSRSQVGGESDFNPNMHGGSNGMGERSVDPNNNLKLVGDANTAGGTEAYYTDAWDEYANTSNSYSMKSGNIGVTRDYAYSNDYQTQGPQNKLVLTGLTANQSSFSYDQQNWDGSETDTDTYYYNSNPASLSLIGFNVGDFGINFANNGAGSDFQSSEQTYAVSEWAQANVDTFNGLPNIVGIQPASIGASLGTSSTPLTPSQWNVIGDDAFTSQYDRPSLTASDFMRAA